MKRGQLLFVLWCADILTVTGSFQAEDISCVTDYVTDISCTLNITEGVEFKLSNYNLKFEDGDFLNSCPLMRKGPSFHSDCKVLERGYFLMFHRFNITLCNNSTCQMVKRDFLPFENIKLNPPPELALEENVDTFSVTCKTEKYGKKSFPFLRFQLSLQDSHGTETFYDSQTFKFEPIPRSTLKPNTDYCIKARFKADEQTGFNGTWSEWSESKCWKNKAEEEQENLVFILLKYLGPVCVFTGLILLVFSPAARMKIKTLSHTPTPAPFFHPLFQKHGGNLQDWLSPQRELALPHKTEKDLMFDAVSVVPKPVSKDPEESRAFLGPPASLLTFPQCQTSYVGLPGMLQAPTPITFICPGGSAYTRLPSAVWDFDSSPAEVVSSAPNEFLELSRADSGCSCEDLSQSPESSLPTSPADERLPPHYCNDYCLLNKTADGVVPVLLSKESRGVPSESLKTEG